MEINTKDTVIVELRAEVEKLRRRNDTQTLHLVGGFGTLLQVKDDELKKLRTENIELRKALAVYEEQFVEREVHNVTQAFRDAGPGCNVATEDNIIDLTDVAANHEQYTVNGNQVSVLEVTPITEQTNEDTIMHPIVEAQTDVIVISPIVVDGRRDICGPNSFVRNIKCKVRKELKMPGFEYQELRGRTVNKGVVAGSATMADVGCSRERATGKGVIDVDEVVVCLNKKSGFDINNRQSVWKMMTVEEKSKISNAYNVYGDRAMMWDGHEHGVAVYFTDVKALVRQSEIRGNIIDAYTVLLSAEQDRINEGVKVLEKSYFFSSICLVSVLFVIGVLVVSCHNLHLVVVALQGMIKNTNIHSRDKYIMDNLNAVKLFRYVHFPICKESHWTLVVYDTKDGSWKHFNSMWSKGGIVDVHYTEALFVKDVVSEVQRQALRDCWVDTQDFNNPLELVVDCPQQRPDSLDCAVIVCVVMRQYVHHVDVRRSLHGGNCSVLRATMVKAFINDPVRGLKNDTD